MAAPRKTTLVTPAADGASLHALRPRGAADDIEQRKKDHLDIILSGQAQHAEAAGFDALSFTHDALPDVDLASIDLSTRFLGKALRLPYLASSMTGGPSAGGVINRNIAEAAQAMGFAMGVGSQRIALGGGAGHGLGLDIRKVAPDIALYANLGAVQLVHGMSVDDARRAVDSIGADALILHLNPLQEALQAGGDVNWRGVAKAMEQVCRVLPCPVIAKEVGAGISVAVARRLRDMGIAAIDVAGTGGSSWAAVEGLRHPAPQGQALGEVFRGWGLPTVDCLRAIHADMPAMPLIASGGIRHGLDGAKAIALGAGLVGQAGALLRAATQGPDMVVAHVEGFAAALRVACFCTGEAGVAGLAKQPLAERR
jgi:isopentenyl-diphosphate Delta-isomerase